MANIQTGGAPTSAPTGAPGSSGSSSHLVYKSIKLEGVDYNLLMANADLKMAFETAIKNSVAASSGISVATLEINPGSVIVTFGVPVPVGSSVAATTQLLEANRERFEALVLQAVTAIPDINMVSTGPIKVTHCGVSDIEAQTKTACVAVATPAFVAAHGSMPGDLNVASQIMSGLGEETRSASGSGNIIKFVGLSISGGAAVGGLVLWLRKPSTLQLQPLLEEEE